MRLQKKSLSKVELTDLLRRKKSDLKRYLAESGIVTYELLVTRCNSMGVIPPSEDAFKKAKGHAVLHEFSSPTEGIVVLPPLKSDVEADNLESKKLSEIESSVSTDQFSKSSKINKKKKK